MSSGVAGAEPRLRGEANVKKAELIDMACAAKGWLQAQRIHEVAPAYGVLAGWALLGMPSVRMDHSLAADLLLTEPPSMPKMPWLTFLIEVPNGLITVGRYDVTMVLASASPGRIGWLIFCGQGQETIAGFSVPEDGNESEPRNDEERVIRLVDTLVKNVCIAATSPGKVGPGGSLVYAPSKSKKRKLQGDALSSDQYVLGRPVHLRLDDRTDEEKKSMLAAVRNYLATGERKVGVSHVRRGHWANEIAPGASRVRGEDGRWHFGTERVRRFRPPTLVNPGQPMAVRPHVLSVSRG